VVDLCACPPSAIYTTRERRVGDRARSTRGRDLPHTYCPRCPRLWPRNRRGDPGSSPRWPSRSQVQRSQIHVDKSLGTVRQCLSRSAAASGSRLWAQFWSHSPPYGTVHRRPRAPRPGWPGRWRPVVNGGAQSSKACEGATPPWVQIPPPPPLTWGDSRPPWPHSACVESFCLNFGHGLAVLPGQCPRFLLRDRVGSERPECLCRWHAGRAEGGGRARRRHQ